MSERITRAQWEAAARAIFEYEERYSGQASQGGPGIGEPPPRLTWERAKQLYYGYHCFKKALIAFQSANFEVEGEFDK